MQSQSDIERVAENLLATKGLRLVSCRTLQSLWAGYGHICHILAGPLKADASRQEEQTQVSLILKYITPPHAPRRGSASRPDEGHIRKLLSYQAELSFYTHLAPQLPLDVAVAECFASLDSSTPAVRSALSRVTATATASAGDANGTAAPPPGVEFQTAMLLTDLRPAFPVAGEKRATLTATQVHAALEWLAGFHGHWWRRVAVVQGKDGTPSTLSSPSLLIDRGKLVRPPLEHLRQHGDAVIRPATASSWSGGDDDEPEPAEAARVWLNGGYTYLETRRGEYAGLCEEGSEWSEALCQSIDGRGMSVAELVARILAPKAEGGSASSRGAGVSEYETLIHGDVKSENLFTNEKGDKVAFFDFQYVGLGLGVCDLAKLFTCSVPRSMLGKSKQAQQIMDEGEERLLRFYLDRLQRVSGRDYDWHVFVRHWETALVDWLRFQASWGFWGNTEWLEGRVRSILADQGWMKWLHASIE